MPTRSYFGPARLVVGLREERVTVHLEDRRVASGLREWGGQIQATAEVLWDALAATDVRLRVEDQEAQVFVVSQSASSGSAKIRGTGPAPF